MEIGLHPVTFRAPGGPGDTGAALARLGRRADDLGVHSIWPMDHLFQIPRFGTADEPMLEGFVALTWLAAATERVELGLLATAATYRAPGLTLKALSSLDVLAGGRTWLGLGAGWNEDEAVGLGLPFPPLRRRFEVLDDVLRAARGVFADDRAPFRGTHVELPEPRNVPAPLRRPPILVAGGGEQRTLRLVARHADACNVLEDLAAPKIAVLRERCEEEGQPFDRLVISTTGPFGPTDSAERTLDRLGRLAELGVDLVILDTGLATADEELDHLERILPAARALGRPWPQARAVT